MCVLNKTLVLFCGNYSSSVLYVRGWKRWRIKGRSMWNNATHIQFRSKRGTEIYLYAVNFSKCMKITIRFIIIYELGNIWRWNRVWFLAQPDFKKFIASLPFGKVLILDYGPRKKKKREWFGIRWFWPFFSLLRGKYN